MEENLAVSLGHQERVAAMAEDMSDTTNQSLEQVKVIGQAIDQQAELTAVMQEAFEEVQRISETLLQISMQQVEEV